MHDEHSGDDEALRGLIGRTIGERYRVDEQLGEGSMGAVFKCTQRGLDRKVAVKVLRPRYTDEPMVAKRFDREAMALSKLQHRNCIQVLDVGTTEDRLKYIVMEHLDGRELRALLTGPLEVPRAVDFTMQILAGLEHAHRRGMVHRDLKPENVFVVQDDDGAELIKIIDFGIFTVLDDGMESERLTRAGMVFGTPAYMSPEQAAGGKVDERTDLYAVGVLLYEMLAGKPPFQADAPGILLRMQLLAEPPPLPESVPEAVRAVVARLLAKAAKDRFESARQARTALEQAIATRPATRGGVVFMAAISDAEPEERPRRETQRGTPSLADPSTPTASERSGTMLADYGEHGPPPPQASMAGRSGTMFAEHVPVVPLGLGSGPVPIGSQASSSKPAEPTVEAARRGGSSRAIVIVLVVALLGLIGVVAAIR